VASGSCTGLVRVVPGQRVTAEFGGLGAVTLDLI
jgi:2-keto-4-pentenoate hydratase